MKSAPMTQIQAGKQTVKAQLPLVLAPHSIQQSNDRADAGGGVQLIRFLSERQWLGTGIAPCVASAIEGADPCKGLYLLLDQIPDK